MQVFYALIAMLFLALLSLTLQRGMHSKERRQVVNEVATQLVGVGIDVVEYIGRQPFDEKTDTTKVFVFPAVQDPSELTPKASFGGCANFAACDDIDDFDGMTIAKDVDGLEYSVLVEVNYVDETNPDTQSGTQTYSKEVKLDISSPYLFISTPAYPLTVTVARIFSYDKATKD